MPYQIPHDRIAHETIGDEVVILDQIAGSYFSLTGAGAGIWALLARGVPPERIGPELAPRYDAAPEVVDEAVHALVRELVTHEILQEAPTTATAAATSEALAAPATRAPWVAPRLERFDDLQALLVLDPIHDVDGSGWPRKAPETA
jgi:hypothetical protein